ncbi:MAG: hypothetical protein KJZ84_22100 [Bryobacteraceae bacterium]|nr:hypothetical protein [Bryobacteraceae bacterium]
MKVDGIPVDPWIREQGSDARESIELMRKICGCAKTKGTPCEVPSVNLVISMLSGATLRDRTGDLLIAKNSDWFQAFQSFYMVLLVFNTLEQLIRFLQQPPDPQ